jgi:Phosphatidylinositol-4-phosphate 5-Kinase
VCVWWWWGVGTVTSVLASTVASHCSPSPPAPLLHWPPAPLLHTSRCCCCCCCNVRCLALLPACAQVRFVVMANIFVTELQIHRRFDIKGSTDGRTVGEAGRARCAHYIAHPRHMSTSSSSHTLTHLVQLCTHMYTLCCPLTLQLLPALLCAHIHTCIHTHMCAHDLQCCRG